MIKWMKRMINYLTGFLLLSSLHCIVVGLVNGGSRQTFIYSLVYLPAIILLSESQKQVKYFWQFVICSVIALAAIRFVYKGTFEQTLGTVLIIAAFLFYFYARAKKEECILETPMYYFLALYLVMWFLERQYPSELLEKYAVIGAGIYCLLCMYKINIDEMLQFIDLHGNLERFPQKRLLKSNLLMMGFQTIVVGTGMGIALSTGADGIADKIVTAIRKMFAWLLSFLESEEQHVGSEVSGGAAVMPPIGAEEPSAFMEMLLKLFDFLSWILVIGLTLFVLYKILKKFYQLYLEFDTNASENGDEIEQIFTFQTKEEKRKIKKKRNENLRWDRSPNARIRKIYKRRVLKDLKEIPKASMTPEEIEQNIVMPDGEKDVFHKLYEQARYGSVTCLKEDVDKMMRI